MASKTVLRVKQNFTTGGRKYRVGETIEPTDERFARWPKGAVVARLNNGFLAYDTIEEVPGAVNPSLLNKAELQELAASRNIAVPDGATRKDLIALLGG